MDRLANLYYSNPSIHQWEDAQEMTSVEDSAVFEETGYTCNSRKILLKSAVGACVVTQVALSALGLYLAGKIDEPYAKYVFVGVTAFFLTTAVVTATYAVARFSTSSNQSELL